MTEMQEEDMQKRLRRIEDFLIRFEHIAEDIHTGLRARVDRNEDDIYQLRLSIIALIEEKYDKMHGLAESMVNLNMERTEKLFRISLIISSLLFSIFLGALSYIDGDHSKLYEKINRMENEVVMTVTEMNHLTREVDVYHGGGSGKIAIPREQQYINIGERK